MNVNHEPQSWEIAVDIGGTFTDVVCRGAHGGFHILKLPTSKHDPSVSVLDCLSLLEEQRGLLPDAISRFTHGTTVATNAVLERKGAKIGLVMTSGFRDVLEIGRQFRRQMYDIVLRPEPPVFLAPGRMRKDVAERVAATGEVIVPLDERQLRTAVDELVGHGAEAIAIVFLFAFANPRHELRARELISEWYPGLDVSLSHEVDPTFREYERSVVTAFDAYLKPVVDRYLARLERGLVDRGASAPLQVMQSRGGLASAAVARQRPVKLFLSGPAAGVVGGCMVGASAEVSDLVTIDIGGTSADIALIRANKPLIRAEGAVGDYSVRIAMVDVNTIGSGGGSIARIDSSGALKVGPESVGSDPGPACYGRGGQEATVCDASVVLGYLDPGYFAGGRLNLDVDKAFGVIERTIAKPLGLSIEDAALGIHRVLNVQMAEGIRQVSVRQGIDPRGFALLPLGGAGGLHATALADELGMRKIVVPRVPGVLAAAGLLAAPVEHELSAAFPSPLAVLDPQGLREALSALDAKVSEFMRSENVSPSAIVVAHSADVCFVGQSYTLEVPIDAQRSDFANGLYECFLATHERVYGHSMRAPAKIVNLRTVHRAVVSDISDEIRLPASEGPIDLTPRAIRIAGEPTNLTARVIARDALASGFQFEGPAIVQQADTTTLVEPGWCGEVDKFGNLILVRA